MTTAFVAWELAYLLRFHLVNLPHVSIIPSHDVYLNAAFFVSMLTGIVFSFSGDDHLQNFRGFSYEFTKIFRATIFVLLLILAITFFYRKFSFSRIHVIYFTVCLFVLVFFSRLIKQKILIWLSSTETHALNVLVVGRGDTCNKIIEHLELYKRPLGFVVKGFIQTNGNASSEIFKSYPNLGDIEQLAEVILKHRIKQVFIALPLGDRHDLIELRKLLVKQNVNYSIIPDIDVFSSKNAEIEMLNEMPVITVNLNSVSTLNKYIKRIGEIFITIFNSKYFNKYILILTGIITILLFSIIPLSYVVNERGFKFPYFDSSDSDFIYVGNALVFNNSMAQAWSDHPGYLQMMFLSIFYKGYQKYFHTSARPNWQKRWYDWANLYHAPVIAEYFNPLFRLARIYSYFLAIIFCFTLALFVRYFFDSWYYGLITALFLSTSRGVFVHLVNLRPELLSTLFLVMGLLIIYSSKNINKYTFIKAILIGFLFYCSIITKITVIPILLILPWLVMFWKFEIKMQTREIAGFSIFFSNKYILIALLLIIVSLCFPVLHVYSIYNNPRYYHMLIIANYIIAAVIFCLYKINDVKLVLIWLIFLSFGASIASILLFYRYTDSVLYSVTNFIDVSSKYLISIDVLKTIKSVLAYFVFGIGPPPFPISPNIFNISNYYANVLSSPIVILFTISMLYILIISVKSNIYKKNIEIISLSAIPVLLCIIFFQRSFFNEYLIYLEIILLIIFIQVTKVLKYSTLTKCILLIIIPVQLYFNYKWVILPRAQTIPRFCEVMEYVPQFYGIIMNDHTDRKSNKSGIDRIAPLGQNYKKNDLSLICLDVLSRDYEIYFGNVDKSFGK